MNSRRKVFCIGMFKTGTTSVGAFLEGLGYRSKYKFWNILDKHEYSEDNGLRNKLSKIIEESKKYNAFADSPWIFCYKEMEEIYPKARFINTVRAPESIVESEIRQYIQHHNDTNHPPLKFFRDRYLEHQEKIDKFFSDKRDKLLQVNITQDQVADKICDFLEIKNLYGRLPYINSGRNKWSKESEEKFQEYYRNLKRRRK